MGVSSITDRTLLDYVQLACPLSPMELSISQTQYFEQRTVGSIVKALCSLVRVNLIKRELFHDDVEIFTKICFRSATLVSINEVFQRVSSFLR